MGKGRVFIVTGISGTDVQKALEKFNRWKGKTAPEIIAIEPTMVKQAGPIIRRVLGDHAIANLPNLLTLPKPCLRDLWARVFDKALKDVAKHIGEGHDVFFTFHACLYHLSTREYICCVDFDRIRKLQPSQVITLVDDLYDVKARLSDPGGLCGGHMSEDSILDHILKLLLILDWRAFEMTLSEQIARQVGVKHHYVLATKHRLEVFDKLLYSDLPKAYLAHSISQVRRLESKGADDAARAKSYKDDLESLAAELRQKIVLFEPTTIDEYRLVNVGKSDDPRYLPVLTERWPQPREDEILWTAPGSTDSSFGHEPRHWTDETGDLKLQGKLDKETTQRMDAIQPLTTAFAEQLRKQLNARDHKLVEQSDLVVGFRPFFDGHTASGVQEELEFHDKLAKVGDCRMAAIIFHPSPDEAARIPTDIQGVLEKWREDGSLVPVQGEQVTDFDRNTCDKIAAAAGQAEPPGDERLGKKISEVLKQAGWQIKSERSTSALGPEDMSVRNQLLAQLGKDIREARASTYLDSLDSVKLIGKENDVLPPSALARQVLQHCKQEGMLPGNRT